MALGAKRQPIYQTDTQTDRAGSWPAFSSMASEEEEFTLCPLVEGSVDHHGHRSRVSFTEGQDAPSFQFQAASFCRNKKSKWRTMTMMFWMD